MEWYKIFVTTGEPTIAILWVGYILKTQIKAQGAVMKVYKDLVDSIDNVSKIHDIEKAKIKDVMSIDIEELSTQNIELVATVRGVITIFEEQHQLSGRFFDRKEFISNNLPNCHKLLS